MTAILSNGGAIKATAGSGKDFKKKLSLVTLTFQNSAAILIMHYSRVMPPSGDHRYFTSTAVFLNELTKLAISLSLAMHETSQTLAPDTPTTVLFEQVYNSVFAGDGWKLAVPAVFYTLQNLLQYVAVSNLDPVHFQVLYQLKILTTALFSVTLLRRPIGLKGWTSLIILTLGVCVVSLPGRQAKDGPDSIFLHDSTDHFFPRSLHELGQASPELYQPQSPHLSKRSASYEGITEDLGPPEPTMNYSVGVTAVLVTAAVSGLTGVYFEKLLKEGSSQASVWVRNIQLSMYSLIAAFFGGVLWQDGEGIREHGFFEGYNWIVWSAVLLQAAGGLIASMVIRDADNIVKNFATSISIVISFLLSVMLFQFRVTPTVSHLWTPSLGRLCAMANSFQFLVGTSLVLLATYLYNTPDRRLLVRPHRPPPLRIASLEKAAISPVLTPPVATPRSGEPPRLTLDPLDAVRGGHGLTSSRPSSPMLPRVASRNFLKRDDLKRDD